MGTVNLLNRVYFLNNVFKKVSFSDWCQIKTGVYFWGLLIYKTIKTPYLGEELATQENNLLTDMLLLFKTAVR